MKTKVLFTAALMVAAASGAQAAPNAGSNMLVQLFESQRFEGVSLLADETADGKMDISEWVLMHAKMNTLMDLWDSNQGWNTVVVDQGNRDTWGNFRIYAMPNPANQDVNKGDCPYENAVERWQADTYQYPANSNIISSTANVPNGTYTVTMWAESQDLGDHTHKGGMYVFANGIQQEITNSCLMQEYTLSNVEVTDGTLTLGVRTGDTPSDDNHVVLSAVSILTDQAFSPENPLDITKTNIWVANASCTVDGGWTREASNASRFFVVNDDRLNSDAYSGAGIEYWTPYNDLTTNADLIYQDINGLPNGCYKITAVAMGRNTGELNEEDVHAEGLYLFANDGQAEVTTNVWGTVTATGVVTDGSLRIGLHAGENNGNNWLALSNVKLEYVGDDLEAYANALNSKVEEAKTLAASIEEGQIPTPYITQLSEVSAPACSTSDDYIEAITQIDALIEEVNAAQVSFRNVFLSVANYPEQLKEVFPDVDENEKGNLDAAVKQATDVALASTDAAVWAVQAEVVRTACRTYFEASDKVMDGVSNFEVTPLFMVNSGFDNAQDPLTGWNRSYDPYRIDLGMPYYDNNFGNLDFYQEITLPNGVYTASVQAQAGIGGRVNFYATSSEANSEVGLREIMGWMQDGETKYAEVAPIWAADAESGRFTTGNVFVVDGKLKVGVKTVAAAHVNLYLFFDNFRLTFVSDGLEEIKALYEELKTEAGTIETDGIPTAFVQALTNAMNSSAETASQYFAAYDALQKAMADCETVVNLQALVEECQSYLDNSEGGEEARTALQETINRYMGLSNVEAITAYAEELEAARQAFAKVATPTGEQQFDMTFLVKNPDANGLVRAAVSDYGWVSCTNSWANNFANGDGNNIAEFYESYISGSAFAAGTWVLYQMVNVPAGSYKMTLSAFGEAANGQTDKPLVASVYAGEVKGDAIASTEGVATTEKLNNAYSVSFVKATAGEVQLGIKTDGEGANWVGCNDMKLYKVAPVAEELTLDETQAYAVTADTYANVTMQRTLKADVWNSFCVPFDMTAEQLSTNGITEVVALTAATLGEDGTTGNLTFSEVESIEAGKPYLVKVESEVTSIKVDGVAVHAATPAATEAINGVSMVGNYASMKVPQGAYFISDNHFYYADQADAVNLKGFRAYITVNETSEVNGANVLLIGGLFDDDVTGIEAVANEAAEADKLVNVYDLTGKMLKQGVKKSDALNGLTKGLYIVDGKKVVK